jgi:hypothetical protein
VSASETVAQKDLRDAGAIDHRNGHLITLFAAALYRGIGSSQGGLGGQ